MKLCIPVLLFLALAGCAWSAHYEYTEEDAAFSFVERCYEIELKEAREIGYVEWSEVLTRKQARHIRRLLRKLESGVTPTEDDYSKAGCVEKSNGPESF